MRSISVVPALALLVSFTFCFVRSEQTHEASDNSADISNHQPQKRSVILESQVPSESYGDGDFSPYEDTAYSIEDNGDAADKRSSLFRFGKRGGLFRFGKRGSLFRFGKRSSIFRYGKRGSLFRFGKRGGLLRYGKRAGSESADDLDLDRVYLSNLDLLRDAVDSEGYPVYAASKRDVDGFHWGQEQS